MSNLKNTDSNEAYGYYSKSLKKPFDTLAELKAAEAEVLKAKEQKEAEAKAKKADADLVENAYKQLNAAKRKYKEDMNKALVKHATALKVVQEDFNNEKLSITNALSEAETAYKKALSEFTAKHPEGFHITLKDGDYETTISKSNTVKSSDWVSEIFTKLFNINL